MIYKYVISERTDILRNQMIRFTQPLALNDPFDTQPGEVTEKHAEEVFESIIGDMDALNEDFRKISIREGIPFTPKSTELFIRNIRIKPTLKGEAIAQSIRNIMDDMHTRISQIAILSLSNVRDDFVMWSTYAEEHKGLRGGPHSLDSLTAELRWTQVS